jgi:predicted ester cyclase
MEKTQIVKNLLTSMEQGNFEQVDNMVTDDFIFSGPVPKPIGKKEFKEIHKKLLQGMPDFKFNLKNLNESGNVVNASVQVGGTHTKELPSLMPGIQSVPATNKKVQNPEENVTFTFKGDKISAMTVEKLPNGGAAGILKQLGVTVPTKA